MEVPPRSMRRATYVTAGLSAFYSQLGMGSPPLQAAVIEAYCLRGLGDRESSTRGTYRSVLRQLCGEERPKVAPRFPGSRAQPPYSPAERAELFSVACSQRTRWRRHSALSLICLSMGAGLRAGEIVALRGDNVVSFDRGVEVDVGGSLPRVVPVVGEAAAVLRRLSPVVGTGHLFHPEEADRSYANFVNDFCRHVVGDSGSPKLSVARLRSSFVCDHLSGGTRLSELLELTGIVEVESLLYYARHVEKAPHSKAALRAVLARE